jgi:HEPN domain-containing protein
MPFERFLPDDPREWLRRAYSSLLQAQNDQPGIYLEDLCFNAQQAVEKSLKALLISKKLPYPYTHDINRLLETLKSAHISIPDDVLMSSSLSDYAVEARYPGLAEPVSHSEYLEAIGMAKTVISWVESQIE